jgi:NAD(P)-dependent dehydrogenase (short-subunit alcohol dehydrogenase family)
MQRARVIVVSASSDIGAHLAQAFARRGAEVIGTYRQRSDELRKLESAGIRLLPLDIASADGVAAFARAIREAGFGWNTLVSAAGALAPIGPFFDVEFDAWERSVAVNSTCQLRVLHALYPLRDRTAGAKVIFFAGGGTNSAFDNYSAYCIGKLQLIKMTELLDSECPELQVSIIGTGWVNTKIHRQTMDAGAAAGANLEKTRQFLQKGDAAGASLQDVEACVEWCLSSPRAAVGGRNIALAHDAWKDPQLLGKLAADRELFKLRRRS